MSLYSAAQYLLFLVFVTLCVKPLGGYMARVFCRQRTPLDPLLLPTERLVYRLAGVDASVEMTARQYTACFVIFGLVCTLALYAILRCQRFLPWFFPAYFTTPLTPDLSINTAVSFSLPVPGRPTRARTP